MKNPYPQPFPERDVSRLSRNQLDNLFRDYAGSDPARKQAADDCIAAVRADIRICITHADPNQYRDALLEAFRERVK